MDDIREKFRVDIEKLRGTQLSVLKSVLKEGQAHLKYFHATMSAFKFPEKRIKTHDTIYYESVIPLILEILQGKGEPLVKK